MPTYGRPTKAALLKITQGSCGPVRNPFQKTWNARGKSGVSLLSRASAVFRVSKRSVATATTADRAAATRRTPAYHLRLVWLAPIGSSEDSCDAPTWLRAVLAGRS